jgi:ribosomal protein S18 acetylase RimI-like enzyme
MSSPQWQIGEATQEDAPELLGLQRAAYQSEALLYDEPELPPLTQSLADLQEELFEVVCLTAVTAGRIVGSVRGRVDGGTAHVGRLIVAPDMQGRGIGTHLMTELEKRLRPRVERFEVFTGSRSIRNIALYERLGYRECRRRPLNDTADLVFLEKPAQAG